MFDIKFRPPTANGWSQVFKKHQKKTFRRTSHLNSISESTYLWGNADSAPHPANTVPFIIVSMTYESTTKWRQNETKKFFFFNLDIYSQQLGLEARTPNHELKYIYL